MKPAANRSGAGEFMRGGPVSRFVGANLRALRTQARASVAVVARAADVSESTVHKWESGAAKPQPQHLTALAEVFGVPVTDFLHTTTRPNMQELRERVALTQGAVATAANVSASTVAAIERGSQAPNAAVRDSLADVYGVSINVLDLAWARSRDGLTAQAEAIRHRGR